MTTDGRYAAYGLLFLLLPICLPSALCSSSICCPMSVLLFGWVLPPLRLRSFGFPLLFPRACFVPCSGWLFCLLSLCSATPGGEVQYQHLFLLPWYGSLLPRRPHCFAYSLDLCGRSAQLDLVGLSAQLGSLLAVLASCLGPCDRSNLFGLCGRSALQFSLLALPVSLPAPSGLSAAACFV